MESLAEKPRNCNKPMEMKKPYYQTVNLTEKQLEDLKGKKMGDKFILITHVEVTGINAHDDEPKRYTLELQKGEMKKIRTGG